MIRKAMLVAFMVGALGVPTTASAQTLTEGGVPLEVGAEVTATSTNYKTLTAIGTTECEKVTLHAEITTNSAKTLAASGEENVTAEGCMLNQTALGLGHVPAFIENGSASVHLDSEGKSFTSLTYWVNIGPGQLTCHFEGTLELTYEANTDFFNAEGPMMGTGAKCPPSSFISAGFTLETQNGIPITID